MIQLPPRAASPASTLRSSLSRTSAASPVSAHPDARLKSTHSIARRALDIQSRSRAAGGVNSGPISFRISVVAIPLAHQPQSRPIAVGPFACPASLPLASAPPQVPASLFAPLHRHAAPRIISFHARSRRQDFCTPHTPLRDWRVQRLPASWYHPPPPPPSACARELHQSTVQPLPLYSHLCTHSPPLSPTLIFLFLP